MKLTWKEATLNHIKVHVMTTTDPFDRNNRNVFSIKDISQTKLHIIMDETKSRSKMPERNLDKTLRELNDLNILKHRGEIGARIYEYIPNHHNEELVYKDKRSIGHIRITKTLEHLGIPYEEEKTFKDLKHKSFLRFDIYFKFLFEKIAIEYDGSQHEKAVEIWGGDKALQNSQYRDDIKTQYCKKKGILLFRITPDTKDVEGAVKEIISSLVWRHLAKTVLTVLIVVYTQFY